MTTTQTGQSVNTSILGGQSNTPLSVPLGGVALSGLSAGGTDVTVVIPGFAGQDGAVVSVTVDPATISYSGLPTKIGAGLRSRNGSLGITLNGTAHGGTMVHVTSLDSSLVLLAPDYTSVGTGTMDVFFPDGVAEKVFYVHGLEGVAGISPIEATAPGFVTGNQGVVVEEGRTEIRGLVSSQDALDPVDPFYVVVGIANGGSSVVNTVQPVRPGSPGFDVALISDSPAVGQLETFSATGDTVWIRLEPGNTGTPGTVASGGVAFDGVGAGVAIIHPEIAGFSPTSGAFQSVTVSQPFLTIPNLGPNELGSGMQMQAFLGVSASLHGGILAHIEVDDPAIALVSDNANTEGSQGFDLFIDNGSTIGVFYLQALEGVVGSFNVTVSAPGFADSTQAYNVVQPAIDIKMADYYHSTLGDLQTAITVPDEFEIQVGIPSNPVGSIRAQELRAGSPGIDVTASVDNPALGAVLNSAASGPSVTARIEARQSVTAATLVAGGVAFDGLSAGIVTVTASSPGFLPQFRTSKELTVLAAAFNTSPVYDIGAGLVGGENYWRLNDRAHGGTTVHLEVSDPAVALLAPNSSTAGQSAMDIEVPDGGNVVQFQVHGLESLTGTVTIEATAPSNLVVQLGIPNGTNSTIVGLQARRPGGPPLVATVAVTDPAIAEILDLSGAAGSRQITVIEGDSTTPGSVSLGGLGLRGVGPGVVLVDVSTPGFQSVGTATQEVIVVQNGVALLGFPAFLGSGLQSEPLVARLSNSAHGGTTVRLTTANSGAALISSTATLAGTDTVGVFVPNGQQDAVFYIQALEGVAGTQYVSALINGTVAGQRTLDVIPPAVMVTGLADTLLIGDPVDQFVIQVGVPTADASSLAVLQAVRAGAPAMSIPVILDDGLRADLTTQSASADSLNVSIGAGAFQSPATLASGGIGLLPVAHGPVMVFARPAGFTLTVEASHLVFIWDDLSAVTNTPSVTALHGNYPNPFNPKTSIDFSLARAGLAQLAVYDISGRLVRTLVAEKLAAGQHSIEWNGNDNRGRRQSAGVYLVRLQSQDGVLVHKAALVK